ncbi:MAG: hypothetical protein ACOCUS_04005, partial [Polyangiales bacterium]
MNEERTQPRRPHESEPHGTDEAVGQQEATDATEAEAQPAAEAEPEAGAGEAPRDDGSQVQPQGGTQQDGADTEADTEADILRGELTALQERLADHAA